MLTVEFQYVSKCPRVKEMASNIKTAISQLDFELEYVENVLDEEHMNVKGFGCPSLLVNGRDLMGKVKCEIEGPLCRVYPKGMPSADEIKKFIICNY
ncbi:MAG: DUF2703 domain-containing protein [Ignavibacteriae bacterium]|nr:DUF2703 domain-containing protein [Ignavibacteriota bacterium]